MTAPAGHVALFCDVSFQTALNWWGAVTAPAGHVALFCDVSFQTALNWWGAVTAPAGHIAILVMLSDPGAPAFFADSLRRAA
ncbi:hypothetical protein NIT7321_01784 [Phaeobacter italicus]|uniref:Uncharacterized protein n=1 Tax=Phaeobacter italicus TaxID=481446 RepID=A0A0H5D1A9_9RHOB|nr:hypothetical protein NIT7321_01784 [Phaeobacter italicus]